MPVLHNRLLIAFICCVLTVHRAAAGDLFVEQVPIRNRVTLDAHSLVLNGYGLRKLFGFKVYVAALYLPQPVNTPAQALAPNIPRRLEVTLLRDTTTEQNLGALKDGLEDNNTPEELEAIQEQTDRFFSLIRTVHEVPEGTRITLDYLPATGTRLSIAGRVLGTIPGERFNRAILKIWLGDHPIQLSLKKALLGLSRS